MTIQFQVMGFVCSYARYKALTAVPVKKLELSNKQYDYTIEYSPHLTISKTLKNSYKDEPIIIADEIKILEKLHSLQFDANCVFLPIGITLDTMNDPYGGHSLTLNIYKKYNTKFGFGGWTRIEQDNEIAFTLERE